ncbi:hypothetical protein Dform_01138 [Dehalogenimonas formicexedens]|uniref:Uncharacterized protein n=1 Tax=Dehalogenimonas formicexedens TaxID=1839801 RepID=A0A1P8F7W0_9CHLR|nr:hypothetical protein [Dehalogenimonas formicexedens]APV44472.1 hypothetical protein Dform_01138 [Dehalogenimonas formicexedens]
MSDDSENEPLELPDAIYLPFHQLPGVKIAGYAFACVERALKYSEESRVVYAGIVQTWDLPGCQSLIEEMATPTEDFNTWQKSLDKATKFGTLLPDWPTSWVDVFAKVKDNSGFEALSEQAQYFVIMAFNRKEDLANNKPKVKPFIPGQEPYLFMAVLISSLLDYLAKVPTGGPKVWSSESLSGFVHFSQDVRAGSSATRRQRAIRNRIRHEGYRIKHRSKIQEGADTWFKCRVNPGTIEAYLNDVSKIGKALERSNVETMIAPYDQATGYPRKWRK